MTYSLSVAFKNLGRAKLRASVTIATCTFGVAAYIFFVSLNQGASEDSIDSYIKYEVGNSQVMTKEYFKNVTAPSIDYIFNYDSLKPQLENLANKNTLFEPKIVLGGEIIFYKDDGYLIDGSKRLSIVGLDPKKSVIKGLSAGITLKKASQEMKQGIWMSEYLAQRLGAKIGSPLIISTKTAYGSYEAIDAVILGTFKTPSVFVNMSQIIVSPIILEDYLEIDINSQATNISFNKEKVSIDLSSQKELSFHPWQDTGTDIIAAQKFNDQRLNFFNTFMIAIIAIGVINTMLMSVYERLKEIGIMRAYGVSNKELVSMFMLEGLAIGIIGNIIGTLLGILIIMPLMFHGIDLSGVKGDILSRNPSVLRGAFPFLGIIKVCIFNVILTSVFSGIAAISSVKKTVLECLNG